MDNQMEKRYGLATAISMVVGIVIGSGVFFKAVTVLNKTGGSMAQSLLVIGIVGLICIVCSCVFATLGTKYVKCNGVVDYAEVACGPKYAYYVGWFMTTMYYPNISATLAFISARYTAILLGLDQFGTFTVGCGAFYLMLAVVINSLAPRLSGKLQVSMTVIKLIPLLVMGIAGTVVGLVNGNGIAIFSDTSGAAAAGSGGVFAGICAFAFAYEGWIVATTINSELKNPKRDLPRALVGGALFCTLIYMLYVYSMSATMSAAEILAAGDNLPRVAFSNLLGSPTAGTLVMVFIIISCLGTTNGITLGGMRGMYSLAIRGQGPQAGAVADVDSHTGMPLKSCILQLAFCGFWYFQCSVLFFNGPLVTGLTGNPTWLLGWEADEIVIITQYALYIPIFLYLIFKEKSFSPFQRFVLPVLGVCACLFMCYCCVRSYGSMVWSYLVVFVLFMAVGRIFYRKK